MLQKTTLTYCACVEAVGEGPREVTEDDIRAVMSEAIVRQVLSMGIDHSRWRLTEKLAELEHNSFSQNILNLFISHKILFV